MASVLSDKAIVQHLQAGTVVIEPFVSENLSTSSYDVTLGRYYFIENAPEGRALYNPYNAGDVAKVWGKVKVAHTVKHWKSVGTWPDAIWEGIGDEDEVILLSPGETILGHTNEFIGGQTSVTTMMKARSSMGRNFIEVCKCAGWGDVGYINRWTMEITNNSRFYTIPLVVGRRIAQIVFFDTVGTLDNRSYSNGNGKYQVQDELKTIKESWKPETCLPRMYLDREVLKVKQQQQQPKPSPIPSPIQIPSSTPKSQTVELPGGSFRSY